MEKTKKRIKARRIPQFGIRTLLAMMLVLGVGSGWLFSHIRDVNRERKLIAKALAYDSITRIAQYDDNRTWIERLVGRDLYTQKYEVDAFRPDDEPLLLLSELDHVQELKVLTVAERTDLESLSGLHDLRRLTISSSLSLASLDGIEACTKLKRLWVRHDGNLADISALAKLESLENLCIACSKNHPYYSLKPLAKLPNLKAINFDGDGELGDIELLAGMTRLESLTLTGSNIKSLDIIQDCKNLVELNIRHCPELKDFSALNKLGKLKELSVTGSQLAQIPERKNGFHTLNITNCQSLAQNRNCGVYLTFTNGYFTDLSGIESLGGAERIEFRWVQFDDLSGLSKLTQAKSITFDRCLLGRKTFSDRHHVIKKMKASLPNTDITVIPSFIQGDY